MRTLLCCIARMENDYIREWTEYNKNIGFTNICLYDNNYDGEQDFRDVIGDYIDSGYVILKDYRNKSICQLEAYTDCYAEYGNEYDWLAFFDCDEFITFYRHNTISEYLSEPVFNNFVSILINFLIYGDNDMLYNDGRPVLERFKYPASLYKNCNFYYKSIVRGGQKIKLNENDEGFIFTSPHQTDIYPVCNNSGTEIDYNNFWSVLLVNYEWACIRHYTCKTAREYCDKILRGYPDQDVSLHQNHITSMIVDHFFKTNEVTPEKVQIFKDVLGVDVSYLLK